MPPSSQQQLDRQAQHRLAVLRHAEEITGNVALTCRYYGISRTCFYRWLRRYQDARCRPREVARTCLQRCEVRDQPVPGPEQGLSRRL
jgi:transposase-like protein